jgi:uncharacterized protein (DUF1015 family)
MAEIIPFRATRYAPVWRPGMARLACPPYDVISPDQRGALLRRHVHNFVRVELPAGDPATRYSAAAKLWKKWNQTGVLERDSAPGFYVYETAFESAQTGRTLVRRGFFAALRVVDWGDGVYPHEKTLPTPKADRLRLFKALKAQTSPIQCLFDDGSGRAADIVREAARSRPWIDYRDEARARHRLWSVTDPARAVVLQRALVRAPVVIADGHHRYETSRAFGDWAQKRWGNRSPLSRYVMAYLSPVDDPGLEILPTHRAVGRDKARFVRLESWGRLAPVSGSGALESLLNGSKDGSGGRVGVFWNGRFYRYEMNQAPRTLRGTPSEELAVARLHAGPLLGLGKEDFFFTRDAREAVQVAKRQKGWAFLLAASTVRQVVDVAVAGQVMPPKSTYFYPKIPSGLLAHSLVGGLD